MVSIVLRWEISVQDVYTEEVKNIDVNYTYTSGIRYRLCNVILISNRQKQYFEQRKRQQQNVHMMGSDNHGESSDSGQVHKEHQSLDILNLLNLSQYAKECNSVGQKGKILIFVLHSSFVAAVIVLKSEICLSVWTYYYFCVAYIDQLSSFPTPNLVLFGLYMKRGPTLASGGLFIVVGCVKYRPNLFRIGYVCLQKREGFLSWDFQENKSCLHYIIRSFSFLWFSCLTN